jgi:hypothetical protein
MESGALGPLPNSGGATLVVEGRKFTMEEFLDALTRAVLETARSYALGKVAKPRYAPDTVADSGDDLPPQGPERWEDAG